MSGQESMQGGGREKDRDQRSRESFATRNMPKEDVKRRTSKKKGGTGEKQGQGGNEQGGGQGSMGVAEGAGGAGVQDPGSTGEAPTGRRSEGASSSRPGEDAGREHAVMSRHPGEDQGKVSITELAAATESHHWQHATPDGHGRAHEPQREGFDRRELVRRNAPPITRMSRFDHRGQRPDKRRAHGE